jgi:hypothetical protein
MAGHPEGSAPRLDGRRPRGYQPPRVEQVVTAAEFGREILYAGFVITLNPK